MTTSTATKPEDLGLSRLTSAGAPATDAASVSNSLPLSPPKSRRSRGPQALLAALLIVGGGLGGLILFRQHNQRTTAVVVVAPVAHGQLITRADLAITEVALDGNVATVPSLDAAVGRLAAHDLSPGELVAPQDLAGQDQVVTESQSVIGLLLEAGQYPTRRLTNGDRVDVFAPGSVDSVSPLASNLAVFDVVESSSDGRTLLVSLVVTANQAADIFEASEAAGVRLSLRGSAAEVPATDAPAAEVPETDTPETDAPATDAPETDAPAAPQSSEETE